MKHDGLGRIRGPVVVFVALTAATWAGGQPIDPLIPRQAIVRLTPGADINQYNLRHGTTLLRPIAARQTYLLGLPAVNEQTFLAQELIPDPETVWAELNYFGDGPEGTGRSFYFAVGTDPFKFNSQPPWIQIRLGEAHQQSGGDGVLIGVVDSGVDPNHVALTGHLVGVDLAGWNFIEDNPNVADVGDGIDNDQDGDTDELTGHGTHMTGILAHVAPGADLLPIRALDSEGNTNNFYLAQALYYAIDQGVTVLNVSIGSTYDSQAVAEAVAEARSRGIVVVAAAGNTSSTQFEYPAMNAGALGVTSVDHQDQRSAFSNHNTRIAMSGVGTEVYSTLPGNLYGAWNGTSMATPMIAGAAALLIARHPEWPATAERADLVRAHIMQAAADLDGLNPGYAGRLGAGRLDAAAAFHARVPLELALPVPAGGGPHDVAVGEFTGDQLPDLAVRAGGDAVRLLRSTGGGQYVLHREWTAGPDARRIVAADFNSDQLTDLAVANGDNETVAVWLRDGPDSFAAPLIVPVGKDPEDLAVADLDGDGDIDLVTANDNDDSVTVALFTGQGFAIAATLPVGERPLGVVLGDLNGDGLPEIVSAGRDADALTILRNQGAGSFVPMAHLPVGPNPRAVTAGDFDGDGRVDLASLSHDAQTVSLVRNHASGFVVETVIPPADELADVLRTADLTCDGRADLLLASRPPLGPGMLWIVPGRPAGLGAGLPYAVGADPEAISVGDADGDGRTDVAVVSPLDSTLAVVHQTPCAPAALPGDLNCDSRVDFFDIRPFVLALGGEAGYAAQYPNCRWLNADLNSDGNVDFLDINPFVARLTRL